jgi:diadenosine tetraphosphate (Ap4A) HIT family hydrolase
MVDCEFCSSPGGDILWQDECCRVIRVGGREAIDFPGFCRVIWREHKREMNDLSGTDRQHLMAVVFATESALRGLYQPFKINLASLGNVTPHVHWHVIPRFEDDPLFPSPIWSKQERKPGEPPARPSIDNQTISKAIQQALTEA